MRLTLLNSRSILIIVMMSLMQPMISIAAEMSAPRTPAEIIAATKTYGASYVVTQLFDSDTWVKIVYPGISSGKSDWLEVAKILSPAIHDGASEEMDDALSRALLKQPYAVLPILKELWWQKSDICYFGWDSEVPAKSVQSYVSQLEKALLKYANKENAKLREKCLEGINKTREELRQNKQ